MSFSRFLKNLRYLWRVKLKDEEWEAPYRAMQRMDDYFRYEVMDSAGRCAIRQYAPESVCG